MSSWEPPLEILKALAKRVNDAELFSATGEKRGPACADRDPSHRDRGAWQPETIENAQGWA